MKKIVIFGCGAAGRRALLKYNEVEAFYDNFPHGTEFAGYRIISWSELKERKKEVKVVVAANNPDVRVSIVNQLRENGFEYDIFRANDLPDVVNIIHIYTNEFFQTSNRTVLEDYTNGEMFDELVGRGGVHYKLVNGEDTGAYEVRMLPTVKIFDWMFDKCDKSFQGKRIDLYMYTYDNLIIADKIKNYLGIKNIFAYSTLEIMKNEIIPVPDYRTCYDTYKYSFPENADACKKAAERKWEDNRIYFTGASHVAACRAYFDILSRKYPEYVCSGMRDGWRTKKENVPMTEYANYKYLMDMPGVGWTDRTKILLQLGRPVFMAERPYKEWYYDKLIPMKHYVPIKADLSDLIEKYVFMEKNPDVYEDIVIKTREFVNTYFSANYIMNYLRDMVLKFGIDKEEEK